MLAYWVSKHRKNFSFQLRLHSGPSAERVRLRRGGVVPSLTAWLTLGAAYFGSCEYVTSGLGADADEGSSGRGEGKCGGPSTSRCTLRSG